MTFLPEQSRLSEQSQHAEQPRSRRSARVFTVVEASGIGLVIWCIAYGLHGDLTVHLNGSDQTVGAGQVIVATILAGLAAWVSLLVFDRRRRSRRDWRVFACAVQALSLLGPIGSAVGATSTVSLLAMHLGVGAVLIRGLGGSQSSR